MKIAHLAAARIAGCSNLLLALLIFPNAAGASDAPEKASQKAPAQAPAYDPALFQALEWREVGPYRGGRAAAVAGILDQPLVYYFGSTGGGVWKTTDGGSSWSNVSDKFFGGSIGAVAVSEWDPNVVYVGGGEETLRGNVSHGYGMWKSTDAGKSWKSVGLEDSRHIARIRIHPRNPELVYAALLGHTFGPNPTRGVYRSKDGGASWERVLFVSEDAGAVDLALDPTNPRILYASLWRARRTPYSFESGGAGSGLWKSSDGGDTWKELSHNKGLPKGTLGIIGITVSPTEPENLYAIIEAQDGGVFRSKDGGETWEKTNEERQLRQRAWYYNRIYADPKDAESVYVLNVEFHHSKDGGKSFSKIDVPHGDNHDLWIAPNDPLRMIESNDGGANVSFDGGQTWSSQDNQPTAQFYRVTTDNHFPYRIYGAQQDNSTVRIRSRSADSEIGLRDWEPSAGGESGFLAPDPKDPEIVYGGSYDGLIIRLNHQTGEQRAIDVWPDLPMGWGADQIQYRFQWNFPLLFSPNDLSTLYAAANVLFKTTDQGQSWEAISPDLTRNDHSKMGASGGPITKDNTSVEYYGTIFATAESPYEPGLLWTGSDDGRIMLSRDGGKNWRDAAPKELPEWILVNSLEVHPFEKGGLYVAATRYKSDDFKPYIYKTTDYGQSWTKITRGIPEDHFTRVVRADPKRRGLLYAGTESGLYISFNDGESWQPFQLNLPQVPITDLALKNDDLIAATQGRGFWVLDDVTPLRQLEPQISSRLLHLYIPRSTYRWLGDTGEKPPKGAGTNPPNGVMVFYYLKEQPKGTETRLDFLTAEGKVIQSFKSAPEEQEPAASEDEAATKEQQKKGESNEEPDQDQPKPLPTKPGMNRYVWDLRYPDAEKFPGLVLWGGKARGPIAPPGHYQARLTVGSESVSAPFEVLADPRSEDSAEDLQAQFQFLSGIRDKLSEAHRAILRIRQVREQIEELQQRLKEKEQFKALLEAAGELDKKMTAVEQALYQTKNRSRQDPLNFPVRLNNKLSYLALISSGTPARPTERAQAVKAELTAAIDAELAKLEQIFSTDLAQFNEQASNQKVPAVILEIPPAQENSP